MERKKIDELWQSQAVLEAQRILSHYLDEDAKILFTKGEGNYDSVPNHPAVTDMNASLKTENIGKHWWYCHLCRLDFRNMEKHGLRPNVQYLHDHYCLSKEFGTKDELNRLGYSLNYRHVFDSLLPKSLAYFASPKQIPKDVFKYLFHEEQLRYDKSAQRSTD